MVYVNVQPTKATSAAEVKREKAMLISAKLSAAMRKNATRAHANVQGGSEDETKGAVECAKLPAITTLPLRTAGLTWPGLKRLMNFSPDGVGAVGRGG